MTFWTDLRSMLTVLCGISLLLSFAMPDTPLWPYAALAFGAYNSIRATWESLRERSVDVNLLMILAAIGAVAIGEALDAAALLFLFSLAGTLEAYTMARTRSAIEGLVKLRPDTAVRVGPAGDERVPVEALRLEDLIRVPPFEPIPVDGEVLEGESAVDQSAMTGESIPVPKAPGDAVLGGTRNGDGMLLMRVGSTVGDTTLDKIVALVTDAQENKASGERISAWFGQRYTFFVIAVFVVSLVVRLLLPGSAEDALYRSLVLLVALSPCALVISVPATTLSALAWAARSGVLVRGGEFIERSGQIEIVAFDKTGTLTSGHPELREICLCAPVPALAGGEAAEHMGHCWQGEEAMSEEARELLQIAATLEQHAAHPVALATLQAASRQKLSFLEAQSVRSVPGLGMEAQIGGRRAIIGQRKYIEAEGISLPEAFIERFESLQARGMTVAILATDGRLAALGFQDAARAGAPALLEELHRLGVREVAMLTGDTPQTAQAVASEIGIDQVYAGLLPNQKSEILRELRQRGKVMMVGDGVNDAPSLAEADLGVAMGGLGSDVALNAADVVLMHDRLERLPELMRLGRKTNRVILQNLYFAAGVILLLTLASFVVNLPLPVAVLGHEGSTLVVIANGLRLLRGPGRG